MLRRSFCQVLSVLLAGSSGFAQAESKDGLEPLFNGKDLSGWVLVNTAPSTWSVKDSMLICSGKPIGEIRTERMYQNFILEVEWRHMVKRGNAGIFVWADDITARGVPFHRSIEVQVLENSYGNSRGHTTHGDIFPIHGAKMTPINGRGGSRAFPTESRSKSSPEWNHYRIVCQDGEISLAVNGKVVTRGKGCSPSKGYICLESEGGVVHYRNLRIKELPDSPVETKNVAVANRNYRSIYSGLDLSGWRGEKKAALKHWRPSDWVLSYDGKAEGMSGALSTTDSHADHGFVVDVRLKSKSPVRIEPRGFKTAAITLDPNDEKLQSGWNRVEGTVRGNRLTVTLNGKAIVSEKLIDGLPKSGPLTLNPQGATDFANIFVRKLER